MIEDVFKAFEWFNIEKYDKASKELSYGEWIYLLWCRYEFWNFSHESAPGWNKKFGFLQKNAWEIKKRDYLLFIEQIINGDAIDISRLKIGGSGYDDSVEGNIPAIIKINASHLQFIAADNSIDGMTPSEYVNRVFSDDPEYIKLDNRHVIDIEIKGGDKTSDLYVEIDLNARDDVILDGVRKLLIEERTKRGINPVRYLTNNDMKKFVNLRLLHYLDVTIFCKATSLDVNNVILSKIQYPDEYEANPVERIRKTMPELAKSVMNERFLLASEYKHSLK